MNVTRDMIGGKQSHCFTALEQGVTKINGVTRLRVQRFEEEVATLGAEERQRFNGLHRETWTSVLRIAM